MTRFLVGLFLAALTLGRNDLAAQRPAQRPPAPSIERAGPEGPPAGAAQLTRADVQAWLDGFLPYALQRGDIAGAVVAVVKDGEVLFKKGYGYADLKRKKPVDPDRTLFRPGSVSKLFTWTAVMQLVEQGKLDLDEDVNTYLDFKIPAAFGKPITLRNVMTHTPGFEEVGRNLFSDDTTKVQPNGDWLKSWTPTRIYPPGTVPAYSNYATALAGYIVQRVSGEPFEQYIEHHIFQPLGMEHATFRQPLPASLRKDMSEGYESASSGEPKPFEMVVGAPAGALSASGADMGAIHDRPPAERPLRPGQHPSPGDGQADAHDRAHAHAGGEPDAARLLRDQPQRSPGHRPRGRHLLVPQRSAPLHRRWHRHLHLDEQPR